MSALQNIDGKNNNNNNKTVNVFQIFTKANSIVSS